MRVSKIFLVDFFMTYIFQFLLKHDFLKEKFNFILSGNIASEVANKFNNEKKIKEFNTL